MRQFGATWPRQECARAVLMLGEITVSIIPIANAARRRRALPPLPAPDIVAANWLGQVRA
jgi:hypothetical protein